MSPPIYNCHIHVFTAEHSLPNRFLLPKLVQAVRIPWLRKFLLFMVGRLILRMGKDSVYLTNRFLARGALESQAKIFEHIQKQYPEGTRFIALPMDLEFSGVGMPMLPYEEQIRELAELRDKHKDALIPFCAVDPRRPHVVDEFMRWHKEYKVRGVKIYPNLGYYPHDDVLMKVYE